MKTSHGPSSGFAAALALSLLAACGGDDDSSGGSFGGGPFGNANPNNNSGNPGNAGWGGPGGQCAEGVADASRVIPRVILVVDGSCSMTTNYPANGPSATSCDDNPNSRWSALRNALLDPQNGVVARLQGLIEFGLVVFGTEPQCPLTGDPIQPAIDNFGAIDNAFGRIPPGMFTPTGAALDWVYENMIRGQQLDSNAGPEIVILATDGEPNSCDEARTDYEPSVNALMAGRMRGVTTYVVSLANASGEFHDHLQQLADIGANQQGAQLYEPNTPQELAADLELLIGGTVGCDLALNGAIDPGRECEGTVTLNGQALGCNDPNGWQLVDSRHIRVVGAACDQLMQTPNARLQARFPCGVFMVD